MIGWSFPSNADGEDEDLNNPGIESFRNSPLTSLAREICQNSLDAKTPGSLAPVEVTFSILELPAREFPGANDFIDILARCKQTRPNNSKFQDFFKKAESVLSADTIPCLLISDFNTTGLLGVDGKKGTDWYRLTRSVGSSDKSGGLGSFGIGKFAPFSNSDLRTVFYSTFNTEGKAAFQGVSRLVTHTDANGEDTRGTGYFGVKERHQPIINRSQIPQFLHREAAGTTIFVAGFRKPDQWEAEIVRAVVDSFFYAVWDEKLVVRAGETIINKASLLGIVERVYTEEKNSNTPAYLMALTSSDAKEFIEHDFDGLGQISLKILAGKEYPKRVAMIRGSGMKIFDKGHFLTPMRFAGVFNASSTKIDAYLKSLEPPQHDSFEPERADNPAEAKRRLKKLYSWIRDCVRSIASQDAEEDTEIEGVSKFLPDDLDDSAPKKPSGSSEEKTEAAEEIQMIVKTRESFTEKTVAPVEPSSPEGDDSTGESEGGTDTNDERGGGVSTGQDSPAGNDGQGGQTEGAGTSAASIYRPVNLKSQRIFSADGTPGIYIVSFEPEIDGTGELHLNAIGEVGQEPVSIAKARFMDSGEGVPVKGLGKLGPISFRAGQKTKLEIRLDGVTRCALGVAVHAN